MRKTILILSMLGASTLTYAQLATPFGVVNNTSTNSFVGVGTTSPISPLEVVPGSVLQTTIGGEPFYLGLTVKTTSRRSGFVAYTDNNYLNGDDNNGHFVALFPHANVQNINDDLSWKAFRLKTGAQLEDKFWIDKLGNSYFAGNMGIGNQYSTHITLGHSNPSSAPWIRSFIGFNLSFNNSTNNWNVWDNANKGTNAILTTGNRMKFAVIQNGSLSGNTITQADMEKYILMSMHNDATLTNPGAVIIGTALRDANLYVNGTLKAHEIEVKLTTWADFVFEEGYNLTPLEEVEEFIEKNNHLPNVPSEKEVCNEGINLAEMDAILLRKIEELTLYIIELEKKIAEKK